MSKITALCSLCLLAVPASAWGQTRSYRKATEGQAVVMKKLYPKKRKVEFAFNFGALVNQSYIETLVFNGGLSYHLSEYWGIVTEGSYGLSFDKSDRFCLEHFLNKGKGSATLLGGADCFYEDANLQDPKIRAEMQRHQDNINFGPAYVPIVQIEQTAMAGAMWTPIYGKQIFTFLPRTSHMDFYVSGVAGVAIGSFYAKSKELKNGDSSRFSAGENEKKIPSNIGAGIDDVNLYGANGRPDPQKFYSPAVAIGIGQKYHIARWLFLRVEVKNYAVFAVHDVFYHSVFAVRGGLGVIL